MKYALLLSAALCVAFGQAQPALAQSPGDLVKQAVDALGGADALRGIKTAVSKGTAKHWEPGQSYSVNGEARFLGDSNFTLSADVANSIVRVDWDRDMKYLVEKAKYSEITTPTYGAVIDEKGEAKPMSGIRLASLQRELRRGSPALLLPALASPQNVAAIEDQKLGDQTYPAAVVTVGAFKYTVLFDRTTKLPAAVRTRDEDNIWGDQNYDMVLSDWTTVGGVKYAKTRSFRLGNIEVQRLSYTEFSPNATISPATYALRGERAAILDGASVGSVWGDIWPMLIIGIISVPLGIWVFRRGELHAKKHGKLKRSG